MADELEMVRRMADGTPRYMATEEDTRDLARVIMDLRARVEAMEDQVLRSGDMEDPTLFDKVDVAWSNQPLTEARLQALELAREHQQGE